MKPSTIVNVFRKVHNWPEVFSVKFGYRSRRLSLLATREGVDVLLRCGYRDWDIFRELFLRDAYARSFAYIAALPANSIVLDLGGNIGCFSLRAASLNPKVSLYSFEPGLPNLHLFRLNLLANPRLASRIELHPVAVAGRATEAFWSFNEDNAGGSSLYAPLANHITRVTVRSFSEVVTGLPGSVSLAKIDIEGAEYDLIRHTPREVWSQIAAFTIELHDDPDKKMTHAQACEHFRGLGYHIERDDELTLFCHRSN